MKKGEGKKFQQNNYANKDSVFSATVSYNAHDISLLYISLFHGNTYSQGNVISVAEEITL